MKHARRIATGLLAVCVALAAAAQASPHTALAAPDPASCVVLKTQFAITHIFTNNHHPIIEGTADVSPGAVVTVTIGAQSHTTGVAAGGAWTLTWAEYLDGGTYEVNARVDVSDTVCDQDSSQLELNHPPVAVDDHYSTPMNTQRKVTDAKQGVLGNDTDADGGWFGAWLVAGPSNGTLEFGDDGTFTYTPNQGFTGADSFTYQANDDIDSSRVATVTITVIAAPPPPVHTNHAPVAHNDGYAINEDGTLTVHVGDGVLTNDSDPDGDGLSAVAIANPAHGNLVLSSSGAFTYMPTPLFHGTDTFTYRASDGALMSDVATVTITVNHVNHAPEAGNDAYSTVQAETLTVPAGGILGNDLDKDGDPITAMLVTSPAHGTLTLNPNGGFTYTPEATYTGEDGFAYKVTDGQAESNLAGVFITVRPGVVPVRPVLQGAVTDAVTARPLENAQVSLFWADTPLNRQLGRTVDSAVATQATTARGAFSWQVEANGDYYLKVALPGYAAFDSRSGSAIHVGTTPVNYDVQLQPIHRRFILGYPDGMYRPERSITRAEIAAIFARIIQPTRVELMPAPFADVPATHWANTYIELVREKGLMVGSPDGDFHPDAPITRAELAQIIVRFRGLTPLEHGPFTDTTGNWAEQAINAAYAAGLITGYPDNTFHPAALTTRAEAATMINRVLGRGPLTGRSAPTWPDVPFDHWASGQVEEASSSHTADGAAGGGEHWTSDTGEATW